MRLFATSTVLALAGGAASAQLELTIDLSITSVSPAARQSASFASANVYSLNRRSGEIVYNRAGAFHDAIYNRERWRRMDPLAGARGAKRGVRENRSLTWRGPSRVSPAHVWDAQGVAAEPWRATGATRRFELVATPGAISPDLWRPAGSAGDWRAPAAW